jgi:hypothetical protein
VDPIPLLIALFVAYVALVSWQMRRALRTTEPATRLTEARRLLILVTLGLPLLAAFILVAV